MKKLETLTPEQTAILPTKRDEWISRGLSTEPANRAEAERGVELAYRAAGLEPPRFMIWVDSPYAGAFAQALAPGIIAAVGDQVGAQVGDQVWDQVRAQVRDQVRDQVWAQVRAQVRDQVRDQVGAQVRAQVWAQVWAQVRAQEQKYLRGWSDALVSDYYGIWWSSWIDTMRTIGVNNLKPWDGQKLVASNAYWWWCFKGYAVLSDRPSEIYRDEQGRLHNETGQAITWRDGWGFHSWHGTRVPEWVITEPDVGKALKEPNSEIRRAAFERIGWADAVIELGLTPIGTAPDPGNHPNLLELYSLPEQIYEEPVNLLLMVNGSPDRSGAVRRYGETVPASITDPLAAAAWQYGVQPVVYANLARRT